MTKYEALETTTISQENGVKIDVKLRSEDAYLPYDVSEFAKSLAELTGKLVKVEITQTVIIEPIPKEATIKISQEVIT